MLHRYRNALSAGAVLAALALLDACWIEPYRLLVRDDVRIPLVAGPLRAVHLSDLHVSGDTPVLRRLLAGTAAARPDLIVVSGDLIRDLPGGTPEENLRAAAAFVANLRRTARVVAVQGHSEHQGDVVAGLRRAGLLWLSNEGRRVASRGEAAGGLLLLGVNQQAGEDAFARRWTSPFQAVEVGGRRLYGARRGEPFRNFYSHWDPQGGASQVADDAGPLSWSGYELVCDVWIDDEEVGAGVAVHSRFPLGEDRMLRLRRVKAEHGNPGSFVLVAHGTELTAGNFDTGVEPQPRRWYRLRVRTETSPGGVRITARSWPADSPEPEAWQAWAEQRSADPRERVEAGTVGLWAWGGGTVAYRRLRVTGLDGRLLLDAPLGLPGGAERPEGFRTGTRGTRLELALARSPRVPPGTPVVVLSHSPDVAMEASRRGIEAVLAGHTHGGQVRIPGVGALTTRTKLGAHYGFGRFELAAPNRRGWTTLFVHGGVGMSVLPVRFACPPRWAVVDLGS